MDEPGTIRLSGEPPGKGPLGGAEEQHRLLRECVTDYAIFFLDAQGQVAAWNAGAERIFGYPEAEIVGQPFSRFFTPDDVHKGLPEKELQAAATAGRASDDRWLVRRDGARLWCSGVTTALRDEGGDLRGFAKVVRDISERRRADETSDKQAVAPTAHRRILVVDDNVDAAESLAVLLRLEGHEVRVACGGQAALAAAQADPPEVVVLDLGMPGMDGFEVARRLRALPGSKDALLVALTGWAQEEDRRRCYQAGFDGHMPKPVEWDALRQFLAHPKLVRRPPPGS